MYHLYLYYLNFPNNQLAKELPNCNCGFPCDVKQNEENNYLYFRCAKKNMWEEFKEQFDIDEEPCNFYMEYSNWQNKITNY